jgi:hypothetical protein
MSIQSPSGIREMIRDRRRRQYQSKLAYYFCSGVFMGIVLVVFLQGFMK